MSRLTLSFLTLMVERKSIIESSELRKREMSQYGIYQNCSVLDSMDLSNKDVDIYLKFEILHSDRNFGI